MAKDLGFAKVWHGAYYMHGAMNVKLVRGNLSRTSLTEEDNTSSSLGDDVSMELTFDDGELHGRSEDEAKQPEKARGDAREPRQAQMGKKRTYPESWKQEDGGEPGQRFSKRLKMA